MDTKMSIEYILIFNSEYNMRKFITDVWHVYHVNDTEEHFLSNTLNKSWFD